MIKRPSPGDTEQDILQMQKDFLLEKYKNQNFEPAAKVVKQNPKTPRAPSSFAQKRASEKNLKSGAAGEALDKTAEDVGMDEEANRTEPEPVGYQPIIGDIVERPSGSADVKVRHSDDLDQGFPKPSRLNRNQQEGSSSKSLFAMARSKTPSTPTGATTPAPCGTTSSLGFGSKSFILSGESEQKIHEENVRTLQSMNEADILDQRNQLLETMDPDLIRFLRSKRNAPQVPKVASIIEEDQSMPVLDASSIQNESTLDIFEDPNYGDWQNFGIVEPAKLEWMRDVKHRLPELKPGETYEARFDWKGVLLPYALPDVSDDNRELYMHGDDAQRPGYTLQELFRLARSNIVQQRISAISSIAGLVSIYQQGFYDSVLDVPISKIFFLLRFAFDDNVPAILEVTSKALAALFHNDADEILLDFIRDCSSDFREPILSVSAVPPSSVTAESDDEDLEKKFAKIELEKRSAKFGTTLTGDEGGEEASRDTLNDFHLAEIDLIDCFLRTNIMQRINYILFTVRPDHTTVTHCLKLLVRLARSGASVADTLFDNDLLLSICQTFLVCPDGAISHSNGRFYEKPQYLALKLVRIVASYGRKWCERVQVLGVFDILKSIIFVRSDITVSMIKIQIEAFRLAKVMIISNLRGGLYCELASGLLYMLEWCYQFVKFELPAHLLFRQHAAALITLISSMGPSECSGRFTDKLQMCCSKWFHQATVNGIDELSQNMLLATCLNACTRLSGEVFHEFYSRYLVAFFRSEHYKKMCGDLSKQSSLLRKISLRVNQHEALPHLNSVIVIASSQTPAYLITQKYSVHLLNTILNLLQAIHVGQHRKLFDELLRFAWVPELSNYLEHIANKQINDILRRNWFIRIETEFLMNILKCRELRASHIDKSVLQKIAYKMSTYLTEDQVEDVIHLFDNVLFEPSMFAVSIGQTASIMQMWKQVYQHLCFEGIDIADDGGLMVSNHRKLVLAAEWPYLPILKVLRSVTKADGDCQPGIHERDLLRTCLIYTALQKNNYLECLSPTEELLFLMISHLGPESTFLEPDINAIITERVRVFFRDNKETVFKLDDPQNGAITFENLYLLFIDHFEGTSYGDVIFGALLMVPLSQKYNLKWRQLVWSEHMNALRFIQCTEAQLAGSLDDYLYPVETDVTMLKYYFQAINSVTFAQNSIPRRIAEHHLQKHREAVDEMKNKNKPSENHE